MTTDIYVDIVLMTRLSRFEISVQTEDGRTEAEGAFEPTGTQGNPCYSLPLHPEFQRVALSTEHRARQIRVRWVSVSLYASIDREMCSNILN